MDGGVNQGGRRQIGGGSGAGGVDASCPRSGPGMGADCCRHRDCGARTAVFDPCILDDLATVLDDAELDAYLALLEPTVGPRVERLGGLLEAGEWVGLLETAHALAGGAACYGLIALSAAARAVESGARATQVETLRGAVTEARDLVEESLSAVSRWRCRWKLDRPGEGSVAA